MTPRKLKVCFATFPYGGNGATAKEHPDIRDWLIETIWKARHDERIDTVDLADYCDTPITMTRNRAVREAQLKGVDVLVMIDSDQKPDMYLGHDPSAVPFWDASFDYLYEHYDRGPTIIGAPYMGGPPHENVFVFTWANHQSDHPNTDFKLRQYSREEAFGMAGIQPCAALPTGLIMFDVRAFEATSPARDVFGENVLQWLQPHLGQPLTPQVIEGFLEWVKREKYSREQSWFYYEYETEPDGTCYQDRKASTEDVTATRDLSMLGLLKHGYNPVHCAWSSWAGHWKPKCVGRPQLMTVEGVASKMVRAAREARTRTVKLIELQAKPNGKPRVPVEQMAANMQRFEGAEV